MPSQANSLCGRAWWTRCNVSDPLYTAVARYELVRRDENGVDLKNNIHKNERVIVWKEGRVFGRVETRAFIVPPEAKPQENVALMFLLRDPLADFRLSWPVDTPDHRITQAFRHDFELADGRLYYHDVWHLPGHEGVDLFAPSGVNILAAADGIVESVAGNGPYGTHVRINHQNSYHTLYAHLFGTDVVEGQEVKRGAVLGPADATGNVFPKGASHLHFGLKRDGATARRETDYPSDIINPMLLLNK